MERRKSSVKNLREIIREVQARKSDGRLSGLVVCAHPMGAHGIFDTDSIADWLQREEWIKRRPPRGRDSKAS